MVSPSISAITFDKASYNPGDTITATVTYTPGTSPKSFVVTGTVTDTATGQQSTLQGDLVVNEPDSTTVAVTDSGGRTWTKISDSGTIAKFTATA